jgi:DNA-binding XRE family transcriptional regulator
MEGGMAQRTKRRSNRRDALNASYGVRSSGYGEMLKIVGTNARALRQRRKIRQRDLAAMIGKSQTRISRIEKNHFRAERVYKVPLDLVCDVATALGVPAYMLFMPGAFGVPTDERIQ